MWKAAETRHHVAVTLGPLQQTGQGRLVATELLEQLHGGALVRQVFRMLEGQIGKLPLHAGELTVQARRHQGAGRLQGHRVAGKGARRAAKAVAGELVEHDDAGQSRQWRQRQRGPVVDAAFEGALDQRAEALRDVGVESRVLAEPLRPRLAVRGVVGRAEPERQDLVRGSQHPHRDRQAAGSSRSSVSGWRCM